MLRRRQVPYEEAKRCPVCNQPGLVDKIKKMDRERRMRLICKNKRCQRYNLPYIVESLGGAIYEVFNK